jgi:putative lipoprotein
MATGPESQSRMHPLFSRVFGCVVVAMLASGCTGMSPSPQALTIKGELTYAARVALPGGDTRAIVELRDPTQPEGQGVVAEQRIDLGARQVPIPFALTVDSAKLDAGRTYAVRGGITIAGRPAWATDPLPLTARAGVVDLGTLTMQPVRLQAFPTMFQCGDVRATVDFLDSKARLTIGQRSWELRQTRSAAGTRLEALTDPGTWFETRGQAGRLSVAGKEYPECRAVKTSGADLRGVEWVVESIDGGGIIDRSRATLVFGADGRVTGRGSCNTYTGAYVAGVETLAVAEIASTTKACAPSLMAQETRFHEVLKQVKRFEFRADGALVLHTDDRRSILARRGGPA